MAPNWTRVHYIVLSVQKKWLFQHLIYFKCIFNTEGTLAQCDSWKQLSPVSISPWTPCKREAQLSPSSSGQSPELASCPWFPCNASLPTPGHQPYSSPVFPLTSDLMLNSELLRNHNDFTNQQPAPRASPNHIILGEHQQKEF